MDKVTILKGDFAESPGLYGVFLIGKNIDSVFCGIISCIQNLASVAIFRPCEDFSFDGIAENEEGWWYLEDGKVQFDYTGWITSSGKKYYVENGKVQKDD